MSKVSLEGLKTGYRSNQKLSAQLEEIQEAFDNTLSRDGTSPNEMLADLDMNSNRILNLPAPTSMEEPLRLLDLDPDQIIYIDNGGGGPAPALPIVQAVVNGDTTHVPSGDAVFDYVVTAIADAAGDGSGIAAIPLSQKGAVNGVAPLDASGQVSLAYLPDGVPNGVASLDNTGKVPSSQLPPSSGGTDSKIVPITAFGAVGDDTFDNTAVFTAIEADSVKQFYVPQGTYYTTQALTGLTKKYWGPGKIRLSAGDFLPGNYTSVTTQPAQYPVQGATGWFRGDSYHFTPEYIRMSAIRKGLDERYVEGSVIPYNNWFTTAAGWSGASGHMDNNYPVGSTTVGIKGGTAAFNIGDQVGFITDQTAGGAATAIVYNDRVTITNKTSSTITFTPALTVAAALNSIVTHGPRTMHPHTYTMLRNSGGGDAYCHLARAQQNYVAPASQVHCFEGSTVGQYGGDIVFNAPGSYATGWESYYGDQGHDVAVIGHVDSYVRTNDTAAKGGVWIGILQKNDGTKPIDAGLVFRGAWRVGIDTTQADFSSNAQAAIQMGANQRLYFNGTINSTSGRSSVPGSSYGVLWGNTPGDSYMTYGADGTSPYVDTFVGSYRTRIRSSGTFSFNGNMSTAGDFTANQDVIASRDIAAVGKLRVGMLNSPVYLYWDGSNLRATKNAGASSVVII